MLMQFVSGVMLLFEDMEGVLSLCRIGLVGCCFRTQSFRCTSMHFANGLMLCMDTS